MFSLRPCIKRPQGFEPLGSLCLANGDFGEGLGLIPIQV